MSENKLTIRATQEDWQHVATIAQALRATSAPFATRTDAVRTALREAAERASQVAR